MHRFLPHVLTTCALAACGGATSSATAPTPNVVIVFVDDMGYADIGAYGETPYDTPSLDQMAREGVRFTDFYVSQPVCSASRAALLTGTYSNRIGIHGAMGPHDTHGLHAEETTLAEIFKSRGYATAMFGKWHLGHHPEFLPTRHGFDDFYGIPYSNDMWPHHPVSPDNWGDLPTYEGEEIVGYNTDQSSFTTDFTDRAVAFIEASAAQELPFFLYLAHPMPHVPLSVSEARAGRSGVGLYGDVIEELDRSVGQILASLQRAGIDEETLVLFSSDNGPWLSYGSHAGSAGHLREGKGTVFEGGVRVPFIARWPGTIDAGRTVSTPAMTIDVLPTLAGLIDAQLPARPIDGRSIWPLIAGTSSNASERTYAFYYRDNELHAIRSGKWKLHFPHPYRSMGDRPVGADGIPGEYDYGVMIGMELFDMETDAGETTDVAARNPEVVQRLSQMAEVLRADLGDRLTGRTGAGVREPGRTQAPPSQGEAMSQVARGTFAVSLKPLDFEGADSESRLARMSIDKQISGDLVATTRGQMLSAMTGMEGSAGYVAIEHVVGALQGKQGTFVLQHSGTMDRGTPALRVTVVPDSGTGELTGLEGTFQIDIVEGEHFYVFTYRLPLPSGG